MTASSESDRAGIVVRSFRSVFRMELRLTRFDRWRVPWPGGVPVRGLAYFAGLLVALWLINGALGGLITHRPFAVVFGLMVGLPAVGGAALVRWRVDDRDALTAGWSMARWALGAKRLVGLRPDLGSSRLMVEWTLPLVPDLSGARYRRGRVSGRSVLIVRQQAEARRRGRRLELRPVAESRDLRVGRRLRLGPQEAIGEVRFR